MKESTNTLAWWEKARQFSWQKMSLLTASFVFAGWGLWNASYHPNATKYILITVATVELWVALNAILDRRAKTQEAKQIAVAAKVTAFAVLVSNELAFMITPELLTMKSYEAAQFFAGYGFFRWLFSTNQDGRALAYSLLVWTTGTVAGGGVAINFNSAALQLSWERGALGGVLACVAMIGYLIAQKWGNSLNKDDQSSNGAQAKTASSNGKSSPESDIVPPPSGN